MSSDHLARIKPDVGIITTGSRPEIPQLAGLFDTEMDLHTITDILQADSTAGKRVIVLGGNMAGLQVADFLAEEGRAVFVLHRGDHFAKEMAPNDRTYLMERLKRPGVKLSELPFLTRKPPRQLPISESRSTFL